MIYLFCGILSGAVLGAICVPLFKQDDTLESAIIEETEWDLLQRKKEVILGNIQDLDFEYKCGKLSDEDHQRIRSEMSGEAAMVLHEIETIESAKDLDALIRREVSARKNKSKAASQATACPSCGASNPPSNKFCAECGAKFKH
jgi:zinc-ribbon domain